MGSMCQVAVGKAGCFMTSETRGSWDLWCSSQPCEVFKCRRRQGPHVQRNGSSPQLFLWRRHDEWPNEA